ncbi:TonB-dependent receptor plug domain-containing protein [Maribacter sp.]|nr:TonB-dependent receptor plug domain-containing protein [Maribacter sp.]
MKLRTLVLFCFLFQLVAGQDTVGDSSTICWDTSFSMRERNLDQEFELLGKIFERTPEQTVQLLLFNISVEEHEFKIANGDWTALKNKLIGAKLDGATVYSGLVNKIKNEKVYFFTDGNRLIGDENIPLKKGDFIINSVPNRNEEFLKRTALIARARLMDFAAMLPENRKSDAEQAVSEGKPISGTIYLDNVPSADIEVRIKGRDEVFKTDKNGKFNLSAVPGDSILFSSKENKTLKMVPVGYFSDNLSVFLKGNVTSLDEVVVTEKRISAASNEEVITAYGIENKEKVGYAVQSIGDEEINTITTDVSRSVQNKFSNVNIGADQDLTKVTMRSNTSLLGNNYSLIVVDGIPTQQSDSSSGGGFGASASFIDPESVASITVLKGYAATNRYGTLGNNGVILITTKAAAAGKTGGVVKDRALVQDNIYEPDAKITGADSPILKALNRIKNVDQAYEKYLVLRNFNENSDAFYLDSFSYFKDKDSELAKRIISNLCELHPKSATHLKMVTLAFRYASDFDLVSVFNQEQHRQAPLALEPFYVEGATSIATGNYQEGLKQLSTLAKGGEYGSLKTADISKTLDRDLKNLIFKKKGSLQTAGIDNKYFTIEKMNTRLVMQWSNSASEFNIQFVNPQNRFFNWEHTSVADMQRIKDEMQLGFSMEEFEIYDDLKGKWKINAEFLGNLDKQSKEPLVMLCTLYKNFGYPSQSKEYIWIHFNNNNQKLPVTEVIVN